jgi:calcium/calmodulin-dependent protein kinase I
LVCFSSQILEYLSGGELFDAICQQECYSEHDARGVMLRITYAVLNCHRHGVMHRDLKPENLILVSNDTNTDLKLVDFGFVTPFGPGIPKETRICGTPGYVAPEMMMGLPYGPEVDIWSLGVIMYVLLAGMPPFPVEDKEVLVQAVKAASYGYPAQYWGMITPRAKDLIDHMLVVKQEDRYTIEDVLKHPWLTASSDGVNEEEAG